MKLGCTYVHLKKSVRGNFTIVYTIEEHTTEPTTTRSKYGVMVAQELDPETPYIFIQSACSNDPTALSDKGSKIITRLEKGGAAGPGNNGWAKLKLNTADLDDGDYQFTRIGNHVFSLCKPTNANQWVVAWRFLSKSRSPLRSIYRLKHQVHNRIGQRFRSAGLESPGSPLAFVVLHAQALPSYSFLPRSQMAEGVFRHNGQSTCANNW